MNRPAWQRPKGVAKGTWEYVQSAAIASDYDSFLAEHPLFKLDLEFIQPYVDEAFGRSSPITIADFGCGTSRVSKHLSKQEAESPVRMLNFDLSLPMLQTSKTRYESEESLINDTFIRANLTELNCLRQSSIDLGLCLFSSLGMIHGRTNRVTFLQSARDSLTEHGKFIVHVHNRLHNLRDPGGLSWFIKSFFFSCLGKTELGDRIYPYRNLREMFLHVYSKREILAELCDAGFSRSTCYPISSQGDRVIRSMNPFRAGGYFVVANKT